MNKLIILALLILYVSCEGPQYTLSLDYFRREGYPTDSCQGEVWWNNKLVISLKPLDFEIKFASVKVYAKEG